MDLKEEAALGRAIDRHWYYVAKSLVLESHLHGRGLRILDIGAGSGWFSRRLLQRGVAGRAICVDPGYAEDREENVAGRPLSFRRSIGRVEADAILFMDVLEHVDDDLGLLSDYAGRAAAGTQVFITVPAFPCLWSAHDVFLGHRRRYTRSGLRALVEAAGLKELSTHYYYASIFPAAFLLRLLRRNRVADRSDLAPAPGWLNSLLSWVMAAERRVMRANRAFGLTVVCRCET